MILFHIEREKNDERLCFRTMRYSFFMHHYLKKDGELLIMHFVHIWATLRFEYKIFLIFLNFVIFYATFEVL